MGRRIGFRIAATAMTALLLLWVGLIRTTEAVTRDVQVSPIRAQSEIESEPFAEVTPEILEEQAGLRVLESNEAGMLIELRIPFWQIEVQNQKEGACELIQTSGYELTGEAGHPVLPSLGALIGIPPGAEVEAEIVDSESTMLPGYHTLCPVPHPMIRQLPTGEFQEEGISLEPNPAIYATNAYVPASPVATSSTSWVRDQQIAQVVFSPVQYNPVTGEVRLYERLLVRVSFKGGEKLLSTSEIPPADDAFSELLRPTLLNYEVAQQWRGTKPAIDTPVTINKMTSSEPVYKITISETGLYALDYATLLDAGVDVVGLDPRTFKLSNMGQQVAMRVVGESNGVFDPGEMLLFYGEQINTRYTDENVYWLTWGGETGLRMEERDGTPNGAPTPQTFETTQRWEEDKFYQAKIPSGEEGDHWFGDYIIAAAPATTTITFSVNALATDLYSATMRGMLYGYTHYTPTIDHHTRVYLNGHLVDDATWDGWSDYAFEQTIPGNYLVEGNNEIVVECPFDLDPAVAYEVIFINWFEVDYQKQYQTSNDVVLFDGEDPGTWEFKVKDFKTDNISVYDTTTPTLPVRIVSPEILQENGTFSLRFEDTLTQEQHYLALTANAWLTPTAVKRDTTSDLFSTTNGADYIIITHSDFYTDVLPLATHRAAQGLRTLVVDVQDIYDEFSYGIFDPLAIQEFLTYAYVHWTAPAPTYVLLVGDGNYDFKDNLEGREEPNYIPPYLAHIDPWIGEVAVDNRYVCVNGDDIMPDMHLGRLPVKTPTEAAATVAKIITYETSPLTDDWNQRLLFVADNPDDAGDFYSSSDAIAGDMVPSPYVTDTVYYLDPYPTAADAKAAILEKINEGRLMVNYIGHAGTQYWAHENIFGLTDIDVLTNTGHLPFFVPMSCLDGYYIHPSSPTIDQSSLGETIIRADGTGAIASWSPSGYGVGIGHDILNEELYQALFFDGVTALGPATNQAKLHLASFNLSNFDLLIDTYVLFGDPALRLNVLKSDVDISKTVEPAAALSPGDTLTYTLTYTNTGPATAFNVVITDTLHPGLQNPRFASNGAQITQRADGDFVWDVANLVAGEGGVITITATISPTFAGVINNTASIATTSVESDSLNNHAETVVTQITVADLSLEKRGTAHMYSNDKITYTLVYSNTGTATAHGVILQDALPDALEQLAFTYSGAAITMTETSPFWTWEIADLAPGTGGTLTLTAQVPLTVTGWLTNTASITTSTPELFLNDNSSNVLTMVERRQYYLHLPLVLRSP